MGVFFVLAVKINIYCVIQFCAGSFIIAPYYILNCVCVQRSLEVTRRFVENRDGTFDVLEQSQIDTVTEIFPGKPAIRPFELKTFLKVGQYDQYICHKFTSIK